MKKRFLPALILIGYSLLLIRILVFKILDIRIGRLRFDFSTTEMGDPNFVPFKTILPYLRGDYGLIIGGFNLAGNIGLLVPVGLLVSMLLQGMSPRKSMALALGVGLALEGFQVAIRRGVFDIDDIILNALGVMIGCWLFTAAVKLTRSRSAPAFVRN